MKTFNEFISEVTNKDKSLYQRYKLLKDLTPEDKRRYKEGQNPKDPNTSEKLLKPA